MLRAEGLGVVRDGRLLFEGLSLSLADSQLLELRGANGSGKTSLLKLVAGLIPLRYEYRGVAYRGSLSWDGEPLSPAGRGGLCSWVGHTQGLCLRLPVGRQLSLDPGAEPKQVYRALDRLGLAGCEGTEVRLLSQGQRQRLVLARLLLERARLWLLDEPLTALDERGAVLLAELLAGHLAAGGCALVASHRPLGVPAAGTIELGRGA